MRHICLYTWGPDFYCTVRAGSPEVVQEALADLKMSRLILWRQKSIIVFIFFCEKLEELSQLTFDELCKASGNST